MELYDLLAEKDFEELTPQEQAYVLEECSEEDYALQRQAIVASQALWATETAALTPPVPTQALQALQVKRQALAAATVVALPWWKRATTYAVPIWKVAAAAVLFFLLQQALWTPSSKEHTPNILVQHDTVYLERYHTTIQEVLQPADTIIKIVYKTIDTVATLTAPILATVTTSKKEESKEALVETAAQEEAVDAWAQYTTASRRPLRQDTFLQELTRQVIANTGLTTSTW